MRPLKLLNVDKQELESLKHLLFGDKGWKPRFNNSELTTIRLWAFKCGAVEIPPKYVFDMPNFIWSEEAFEKFDELTKIVEYKTNKRRFLLLI